MKWLLAPVSTTMPKPRGWRALSGLMVMEAKATPEMHVFPVLFPAGKNVLRK